MPCFERKVEEYLKNQYDFDKGWKIWIIFFVIGLIFLLILH